MDPIPCACRPRGAIRWSREGAVGGPRGQTLPSKGGFSRYRSATCPGWYTYIGGSQPLQVRHVSGVVHLYRGVSAATGPPRVRGGTPISRDLSRSGGPCSFIDKKSCLGGTVCQTSDRSKSVRAARLSASLL